VTYGVEKKGEQASPLTPILSAFFLTGEQPCRRSLQIKKNSPLTLGREQDIFRIEITKK
jgi:hypothetical protein